MVIRPPVISILVATWNCCQLLQNFLDSLLQQDFQDWELLLLDNCSNDGTQDVVESFRCSQRGQRLVWSSCVDTGIYDAWNRGLGLARGEYLCFIGADDLFVSPSSLSRLAQLTAASPDLVTARNAYYSADQRFLREWGAPWRWRRMRESMTIAHPGMLVHRRLFERFGGFDDRFQICGDYEWFLRLPVDLKAVHEESPILKVVQAGVSHTKIRLVYAETFRAQRQHLALWFSAGCWLVNWLKYFRRRLIGLA